MGFIQEFSKHFNMAQSLISEIATNKEIPKFKINFSLDGIVAQRDSGPPPVHNVKSENISSHQESSDLEVDFAKRFQGEVQELKQLIEGGNTLSNLCEAIGKQPLPPHLQVAKDNLLRALQESCTQKEFLAALEGCQNVEEIALVIGKILVEVTDRTDNVLYENTLKLLQEVYPDINRYCLDKGDGHRLLSPLGLEVILETLKQKGKLNDIPAHVCLDHEQAIAHLEQLANRAPGEKMSLILRYDDGVNRENEAVEDIHYFAVIAEKTDQGLRIAITDSFSSYHYSSDVVEGIQDRFTTLGIPCKVFIPKLVRHPETGREITFRRQSDSYSCPIFALRDISQFCQHPEILDEIEHHAPAPEKADTVQIVPFERVPKALMKATQSLTKLANYDDQSVMAELRASGKINPLPVKGKPGEVKDANTLIMDRNRKYERIMIAAAIAKGLVKQSEHG